jgi:hypothetical protein
LACGKSTENKASTGSKEDWKTYSASNYTLQYPNNWELDDSGKLGTKFMLLSPTSSIADTFKENVNLVVEDLKGQKVNLDTYAKITEGQIETMIKNAKVVMSQRLSVGTEQVHKIVFTGRQNGFDLQTMQYYRIANGIAYVLTFSAEEDQFDAYAEVGEQILKSFLLKVD